MGNNASLTAAVTNTTISSATWNANQTAFNNTTSYAFRTGTISQWVSFQGVGNGIFNTGCVATGVGLAGVWANFTFSGITGNDVIGAYAIFSPGDTTCGIATSNTGKAWIAGAFKL